MFSPRYVVFGALLVVASAFLSQIIRPALAVGNGPYMLMQHSNVTANAGVFRLDTSSGGVSYCYVTPNVELLCSKEAH